MRILAANLAMSLAVPALAIPTPATNFKILLPNGTTAAKEPVLKGTVVTDTLVPFSTPAGVTPSASGTLQVRTSTGADGKLIFEWKINMAPGAQVGVRTIAFSGFPQTAYDANWRVDGLGTVAPQAVSGSAQPSGWRMAFEFGTPLQASESSRFLFLRSAAVASKPATAMLILANNISIQNIPIRAPQ